MNESIPRTDRAAAPSRPDHVNVVVQPPVLFIGLIAAGCGLDFLLPVTFLAADFPAVWVGGGAWLVGCGLVVLAIAQLRGRGTDERMHTPTVEIVDTGVFAFSRNPIYVGAHLGILGVAIIYNMLWILATLVPFYFITRYGVVAREEAYLERKFGTAYLDYKARVRRWI
jgi:protein-S-isoprenylcysteine O-methyltransferase Ste14